MEEFLKVNILAIETTTRLCSVALKIKNRLFEINNIFMKNNNDSIILMIDKLFKKSKSLINRINLIAFSCGPGSFTGMRVGLMVASGLSIGSNLPIIEIPTMMILAESTWRKKKQRMFCL